MAISVLQKLRLLYEIVDSEPIYGDISSAEIGRKIAIFEVDF